MKSLDQIRDQIQRGARIARRAERALSLADKGIENRHKLGAVLKSAADAAQKTIRKQMFGESDGDE